MGQPYRRHFVLAYIICMTTKPTVFHSIPPRRLVIYLKIFNFGDHCKYHSATMSHICTQHEIGIESHFVSSHALMIWRQFVKYFQIVLVWEVR